MKTALAALDRFVFSGGTPQRLGATRFLLGLGLIPFFAMQFSSFFEIDPFGARFRLIDSIWYFDALGITRFEPLLAQAGVVVLLAALAAFALGWRTRAAALASLALIVVLKGFRDSVAGDVHHRELIPFHVLLFFALSRSGETFSLDALAGRARGALAEWEASWPIRASQLYIAAFYWWSGFAKLRGTGLAWFGPEVLRQLTLERALRFGESDVGAGAQLGLWLAAHPWTLILPGLGVAAMELGFPVIFWLRALWQRIAFVAFVATFHAMTWVLLNVQFLFMPVVFVTFFDLSAVTRRIAPWLADPRRD
ncbi:MAG: hypothetical protein FJ091_08565 [Deltaproteobacteria bacterium]|nr:hypothetical protein [Deltaproteobacteria bacterium]